MTNKSHNRTLTRKDLRQKVNARLPHMSRGQSARITDQVFELIIESLVESESVKLREFGVFKVHNKKERPGRNPMTGVEAIITARRSVKFVPSPVLVAKVNGEEANDQIEDTH